MLVVQIILIVVLIYLALGVIFVIPFLTKGITRVDETTVHGSIGFKIIIIPGVIVFWPVLMKMWMKPPTPKGE